jgi:hypothetical protein
VAKQIIVTIAPDGTPTVKTEGYQGRECQKASKFLEDALGTVTAEQLTPEYHQSVTDKPTLKQGS